MSRSPEHQPARYWPRRLRLVLVTTVSAALLTPGAAAAADDETPSATDPTTGPTVLTPTPAATADSIDGLSAPVRDFGGGPVRDIITTVESIGGGEAQQDTGEERTVILTSGVLFAEDSAKINAHARRRLDRVATQIEDSGATGEVQVDGYTDDQGSAQHGLVLSRRRARAVRDVLEPRLRDADVRLRTKGYGEADPRFPNKTEDGDPIAKNRAKNRRVEITFRPSGG